MADNTTVFHWQEALSQTFQDLTQRMVENIPQFLGAFTLLFFGWIIAWLLRLMTRKFIRVLDAVIARTAQKQGGTQSHVRSYEKIGGDIVFWSVLVFFVAASARMLEWQLFTGFTNVLLSYLPNVLTGLLIILAGFGLSGIARSAVSSTAESIGIQQAELLSRISQVTVVLTAIIIGVEQFGINVAFFTTTLIVVAGVLLGGAALAFGLGAKQLVANVIGAQTTRKHYQLGQLIKIGEVEGYLLEITSTSIILDTERGRAAVPAKLFHEEVSVFIENTEGSGSLLGGFFNKKGASDDPR